MGNWYKLCLCVIFLFLIGATALVDTNLRASLVEPNINEDGTPLLDLKHTTLFYRFDDSGTWIKIDDIPASNRFGGKSVSYVFQIIIPNNQIEFIAFTATCSDFSGNESDYAKTVIFKLDKNSPNFPSYIEINANLK